jgi:peroxiredoxin
VDGRDDEHCVFIILTKKKQQHKMNCSSSLPSLVRKECDTAHSEENTPQLKIGDTVPDFTLNDNEGNEHHLSDLRGAKILLCFYDYSHCHHCAYSVGNLMGHQKKLAWASRLKVITVFLTNEEILHDGLTNKNSPIPRLCDGNLYPFLALADPDGRAASSFKLGNQSVPANIRIRKVLFMIMKKRSTHPRLPLPNFAPAEFLIDENGVLVDILQATKAWESMTMERIQHFLLTDQKAKYLEKRRLS